MRVQDEDVGGDVACIDDDACVCEDAGDEVTQL